tara:strand:- start:203 stop:439 length:237 start_codon:yes stop_codon:yes gene_type:complete
VRGEEGDFLCGFIVASTLWWIIIACAGYNMDSDFDYRQKKHQDLMELCEMIGSSPRSYDNSDLTCVNGLVIDYTTGGK